jgi:hypothetical protein
MADEKRDEGSGRDQGPRRGGEGPEGRSEGGRRHGRHRGFRGRPGGPGGQSWRPRGGGQGGEAQRRDDNQGRAPDSQLGGRAEEKRDLPICPLCGKPLYDLSTALATSKEASDPAHFDCVLERVIASESLAAGEKVVYLGSGTFGVVEYKDKNETAFTVKRRIQWEKEGEKSEWRRNLSSRIANL